MPSQRFDAVEADPEFDDAMRWEPQVPSLAYVIAAAAMLTLSLVFAVAGIALLLGFPAPLLFKVLWLAMTVVFVAIGVAMLARALRYHASPILRTVAMVVGTRTQVSGSGTDGSTSTSYFVTLEDREGQRIEYHAHGPVAGVVTTGDIGVAYLKSRTLVAFRRFGV